MNCVLLLAGDYPNSDDKGGCSSFLFKEFGGKAFIEHICESLGELSQLRNLIIVLRQQDVDDYHADKVFRQLLKNRFSVNVVVLCDHSAGATCSALLAIDHLDRDTDLLILTGDQFFRDSLENIFQSKPSTNAAVVVFNSVHPKWPYVTLSDDGLVAEGAEKKQVSNLAVAGFYYFQNTELFIKAAMNQIRKNDSINGIFYLSGLINQLILLDFSVGVMKIAADDYIRLNSVEQFERFEMLLNE